MSVEDLAGLIPEIRGHFEFESGHHGDTWLELERLFLDPARVKPLAEALGQRVAAHSPDVICGPLTEGAFLGLLVASGLGTPFCYTKREVTDGGVQYRLPKAFWKEVEGKRVAIVDDVVNAGSAIEASSKALEEAGANVVAVGALVTYGNAALEIAGARDAQLEALAQKPTRIWEASSCPLCARGVPLERRA
ncbi:MAG: phosphoribosyltransferase family protein [Pseudomonadota bacterium]